MEENRNENETNETQPGESAEGEGLLTDIARAVGSTLGKVAAAITGPDDEAAADGGPRSRRLEKIGLVTSDKMQKTVVVRVERQVRHQKYKRYIRRRKKFLAHDELGAHTGDIVRIVETRPLSARKRWRVIEIVQKAS